MIQAEAAMQPIRIPSARRALILAALGNLMVFDVISRAGGFKRVKAWATPKYWRKPAAASCLTEVVDAVDLACTLYPKTAACLQRSAVLNRMLRRNGIRSQMIIGVQRFPFRSHAWVEVDGKPVNERQRAREVYTVLDCWGIE